MNIDQNGAFNAPIPKLNKYVKSLSIVESRKDIFNICSNITEEFEASFFSCGFIYPKDFHHSKYVLLSNYDRGWVREYINSKYQIIDPRIRECAATRLPVSWDIDKKYLDNLSKESREMMSMAYEYNIRSGITIPFYSPLSISGVFSLGLNASSYMGEKSLNHLQSITPYITYLGSYINQAIIHVLKLEQVNQKDPLTPREKDCLCWLADGKTAFQTASSLFISESTVKFHCKNSMRKLGAKNTSHALAIAILRGYIKPVPGDI